MKAIVINERQIFFRNTPLGITDYSPGLCGDIIGHVVRFEMDGENWESGY